MENQEEKNWMIQELKKQHQARSSVSDEHIHSGGVWVSHACARRKKNGADSVTSVWSSQQQCADQSQNSCEEVLSLNQTLQQKDVTEWVNVPT